MENIEVVGALAATVVALAGALSKVTMMLLKEKDSKLQMLIDLHNGKNKERP